MSAKIPSYIERTIKLDLIFGHVTKLPETEKEFKDWFQRMACDLSPENLHCDGEISRAEAQKKYVEIIKAWKYLEAKWGRKVDEREVYKFYL